MLQRVLQLEVNYRNIASHFGNATMTVMDPLGSNTPCEQSTEKQKQKAFFLSFLLLQRSGLDSIDFESFLSLQLFSKREYSAIFISSKSNMISSVLSAQVQHRTKNQAFFSGLFSFPTFPFFSDWLFDSSTDNADINQKQYQEMIQRSGMKLGFQALTLGQDVKDYRKGIGSSKQAK